jgi:hypothetical protein
MTREERLLAILESAHSTFGPDAIRRIEKPIRAATLEEPAGTGEELRYPSGLFIPGLKSAPWHSRDWLPDVAILESATSDMRQELEVLLHQRTGFQLFDEGDYGFNPANKDGARNIFYVVRYLKDKLDGTRNSEG